MAEVEAAVVSYEAELDIPVTDALSWADLHLSTWCWRRSPSSRRVSGSPSVSGPTSGAPPRRHRAQHDRDGAATRRTGDPGQRGDQGDTRGHPPWRATFLARRRSCACRLPAPQRPLAARGGHPGAGDPAAHPDARARWMTSWSCATSAATPNPSCSGAVGRRGRRGPGPRRRAHGRARRSSRRDHARRPVGGGRRCVRPAGSGRCEGLGANLACSSGVVPDERT